MKNLELLETKKHELKELFNTLNKSGNVCGMHDIIMKVIDNADDVKEGSLYTKYFATTILNR